MSKFARTVIGAVEIGIGLTVPGLQFLIPAGISTIASALLQPSLKARQNTGTTVQIGEVARSGMFGEGATAGSLVDAFNWGGKYGTDWTVLIIALADHECAALKGFYVYNEYVEFAGDGVVAGYNGQLEVYWRPGTWDQELPGYVTDHCPNFPAGHPLAGQPTWTADDRGRGVSFVVVATKADKADAKHPVWSAGRPTFLWVLQGLKCYIARNDDSVGGAGDHRWDDPDTREWSDNLIDCRYTWARGIYAGNMVADPAMLLLGRGLTATEAPPENTFAPANLCDELVPLKAGGSEKRYTIGGIFGGDDAFIDTENDLAAACGGIIVEREGSVEIIPGSSQPVVWTITDDDLVQGTNVTAREFKTVTDESWCNMVVANYVEPTQKWADHSAPLRRDNNDVIADGEPRLRQTGLGLVTSGTQGQRIAEQVRRMGRLTRTRGLTLPPRLSGVEHGDWLVWQSKRYGPKPAPASAVLTGEDGSGIALEDDSGGIETELPLLTFRVVSDNQGADWRNQIALEEISADVFGWNAATDELVDTSVATDQDTPGDIGAPDAGNWALAAVEETGDGGTVTVLRFTGSSADDPDASLIVFEYADATSSPDPDDDSAWKTGNSRAGTASTITAEISGVLPGTSYFGAVSYVVGGTPGDRLVLGPVTTAGAAGTEGRIASEGGGRVLGEDGSQIPKE